LAVKAAKKAFERGSVWRSLDTTGRTQLMNKLADLITREASVLGNLEALDTGKPIEQAIMQVHWSAMMLRSTASYTDKIYGRTIPSDGGFFSYTRKEAIGVVGQIIPFNFPIVMLISKIAPALAAGCTIVLKPAEQTPLTAIHVAALSKEAGFPAGVLNIIPGYGPTAGAAISSHQDIRKVGFTGSTLAGRSIMEAAAKSNLKKVSLELGGKSPFVVFDDANCKCHIKHGLEQT
jgi:aldehyde dehydrogenase (NAD+)